MSNQLHCFQAGQLGLFTQQEWLVLLPNNTTVEDMETFLSDANIYIDSEVRNDNGDE